MKIFLSHSSKDKLPAEELAIALRGERHVVFFDKTDLPPGETYNDQIRTAIQKCDLFLFLISPNSISEGGFALTEIKFAQQKWPSPDGHVLPVIVTHVDDDKIPPYLKAVTYLRPSGNLVAETVQSVLKLAQKKSRMVYIIAAIIFILISSSAVFVEKIYKVNVFSTNTSVETNKDRGTDFANISEDGNTLFVTPYRFDEENEKAEKFNKGFYDGLGYRLNIYLDQLVSNETSKEFLAPEISVRKFNKDPDIAGNDYARAKRLGDDLKALGIVTGTGKVGRDKVEIHSTFYFIPHSQHFARNKTTIQDAIPSGNISAFKMNSSLVDSWGKISILAYVVKELSKYNTNTDSNLPKLAELRKLLLSVRGQLEEGDENLNDFKSLIDYIDTLLANKAAGE